MLIRVHVFCTVIRFCAFCTGYLQNMPLVKPGPALINLFIAGSLCVYGVTSRAIGQLFQTGGCQQEFLDARHLMDKDTGLQDIYIDGISNARLSIPLFSVGDQRRRRVSNICWNTWSTLDYILFASILHSLQLFPIPCLHLQQHFNRGHLPYESFFSHEFGTLLGDQETIKECQIRLQMDESSCSPI